MLRRNGAGQETMESVRKREGSLGWKWFVEQEGLNFVFFFYMALDINLQYFFKNVCRAAKGCRNIAPILLRSVHNLFACLHPRDTFTNHISKGGDATTSFSLSIRLFPLYLLNRLTIDFEDLHVSRSWVMTIARRALKIKVIGQDQGHGSG